MFDILLKFETLSLGLLNQAVISESGGTGRRTGLRIQLWKQSGSSSLPSRTSYHSSYITQKQIFVKLSKKAPSKFFNIGYRFNEKVPEDD